MAKFTIYFTDTYFGDSAGQTEIEADRFEVDENGNVLFYKDGTHRETLIFAASVENWHTVVKVSDEN